MSESPGPADADTDLAARIAARLDSFTPAERALAHWFGDNPRAVAFQSGAQIATEVGVSEMTLIRFVRALGYANLRDLKANLLSAPSPEARRLDDVTERFTSRSSDLGRLADSLERELEAVRRAYEAATTRPWDEIVTKTSHVPNLHVVGFQATKGVALDFSSRLKFVRPGVRFLEGNTGVYSEVLECDPATSLLVLIDTASYARKGVALARKAKAFGIPMVVVTDRFSHWALEFTDLVLEMDTHVGTFWDSTASLSAVLNLLIHFIAAELGDAALAQRRMMAELNLYFRESDLVASRTANSVRRNGQQEDR